MVEYTYTPEQLLSYRKSEFVTSTKLPPKTFIKLRNIGICSIQKQKRGSSGGKNKIRSIQTCIRKQEINANKCIKQKGANLANLLPVQNHTNQIIKSVIGNRPSGLNATGSGVNENNLTNIKLKKVQNEDTENVGKKINVTFLNAHSIRNKASILQEYVLDKDIDIALFCETWLKGESDDSDQQIIGELCPPDFKFLHVPRETTGKSCGGGVAILYKANLEICMVKTQEKFRSFEYMEVLLKSKSICYRIIILYRPPPSKANGLKNSIFFEEFPGFIDSKSIESGHFVVVGDFNFHLDKPHERDVANFNGVLSSGSFVQHVQGPTHKMGHTLDLVITKLDENVVENLGILDTGDSDHFWLNFQLPVEKPRVLRKKIVYRKHKDLNKEDFCKDIENSDLYKNPSDNISDAVKQFNEVLAQLYNKHAPEVTKTVPVRPQPPWRSEEIKKAKRERRIAERKMRKSKLAVDRQIYVEKRRALNKLVDKAKREYYAQKIDECSGDQKQLFKLVDTLLHKSKDTPLPMHESPEELANRLADFFVEKISKIRTHLADIRKDLVNSNKLSKKDISQLSKFELASEKEISNLIKKSASKSCKLDPIPTWLLKDCLGCLLPVITRIVNLSLSSAEVSTNLKEAIVLPLIKKMTLDPEILKNYRPVSNLSFLSKLIERVVDARFEDHMVKNNLHEKWQSSYKKFHSTETALIRVMNDALCEIDNKKCVLLVLLDLSAAFDTIDHKTLISRLEYRYGVSGDAKSWFESYLTGRTQSVLIRNVQSEKCDLEFGVPQGSILGPKKFIGYSAPIVDIAKAHGINLHLYADDTQLYIACDPTAEAIEAALEKLEACISDIRIWMAQNYLKLNDDKTEFLILGAPNQLKKIKKQKLHIGESYIETTDFARNIGAIFDSNLLMEKHVDSVCKAAWGQLRKIGTIRKYLSNTATKTLVHALVTSRLDNLNGLLYGLSSKILHKLERVQNTAARLITRSKKYDHITPILRKLHWLPIKTRIKYKILLLTYKALNHEGPEYIQDLLVPCTGLRSKEKSLLKKPLSKSVKYGDRAFSRAAPQLWNELPDELRHCKTVDAFKRKLKTYLFGKVYGQ